MAERKKHLDCVSVEMAYDGELFVEGLYKSEKSILTRKIISKDATVISLRLLQRFLRIKKN